MEFKLNACGIDIVLKITQYHKPEDEDDYSFCNCSYSFSSGKWLNYSKNNDEIIACFELEYLIEKLQALLDDKLKRDESIELIEPDFSFDLKTKRDLRKDKSYEYIAEGFEIEDVSLCWNIHLWDEDGGLTDNFLSICLYRKDIEKLLEYLKKVKSCAQKKGMQK